MAKSLNHTQSGRRAPAVVGVCALMLLLFAATVAPLANARPAARHARHHSARPAGLAGGQEPAPSLYGLNTGTYDSSNARFVRDMPAARQLGARWVHFTGASIKFRASGSVDFRTMDYEVNKARSLGMGVIMSLGGIRSACTNASGADVTSCPPTSEQDLARYSQYLPQLLLHYRGRVDTFESWVEPNHRSYWPGGPNPDQYAQLLRTEWSAFAAANRRYAMHDKLLFAGPADFGIGEDSPNGVAVLPFTQRVLDDLNGAKPFDAVALHPYRFPPTLAPDDSGSVNFPAAPQWRPLAWSGAIAAFEAEFTAHGYGQPDLWLTEFGWPGNAVAGDSYHPSEAAQATAVEQAYSDLHSLPFVKAAFWFNLRDYQLNLSNPDPGFFAHYGLLHNDFSPKPAAMAFSRLAHAG